MFKNHLFVLRCCILRNTLFQTLIRVCINLWKQRDVPETIFVLKISAISYSPYPLFCPFEVDSFSLIISSYVRFSPRNASIIYESLSHSSRNLCLCSGVHVAEIVGSRL